MAMGFRVRISYWRPRILSQQRSIQRLRIFLDLDDCLVNSEQLFSGSSEEASQLWKKIGIHSTSVAVHSGFKISHFCVALRPGLFSFLDEAHQIGDLYVFTAGTRDYATAILKKIDPEGKYIRKYWAREMISWEFFVREFDYFYTKDLKRLQDFDPKRSVLIDNQIQNMIFQPQNGILSETSQVMQLGLKHLLHCSEKNLDPLSYTGPQTNSAGRPLQPEYNPLNHILGDLREMKDLEDVRPYLHDKYQIISKLKALSAQKLIPSPWSRHVLSYDDETLI
jgi:hypothetical protein